MPTTNSNDLDCHRLAATLPSTRSLSHVVRSSPGEPPSASARRMCQSTFQREDTSKSSDGLPRDILFSGTWKPSVVGWSTGAPHCITFCAARWSTHGLTASVPSSYSTSPNSRMVRQLRSFSTRSTGDYYFTLPRRRHTPKP